MGGFLESIFGPWGALIIQFLVTIIVVIGLVMLVYWLVRRYSAGGLGRIGRGRVPRLALVDAMAVDGRRRLVLVRRDNVEHLIMIGGPADIVVEQGIQRPRKPRATAPSEDALQPQSQQPEAQVLAAPPQQTLPAAQPEAAPAYPPPRPATAPVPAAAGAPAAAAATYTNGATNGAGLNGADAADGFTFRRTTPTAAPPADPRRPARVLDFQAPTRIDLPASPPPEPPAAQMSAPEADEEPDDILPPEDRLPAFLTQPEPEARRPARTDFDDAQPRRTMHMNPFAQSQPAPPPPPQHRDPQSGATVNDLEREMAKLLDEFRSKPS